jgi:hypothetical protein
MKAANHEGDLTTGQHRQCSALIDNVYERVPAHTETHDVGLLAKVRAVFPFQ